MASLYVGMAKQKVLQLAKGLSEDLRTKVVNFFNNDEDNQISHVNELAILNSIFDGTGKVKMPEDNTVCANTKGQTVSACDAKNYDGSTSYSILYDEDGDGYADGHNMGKYTVLNKSQGAFESIGYHAKDNNIDGVADNKRPFHIVQEGDALCDIETGEKYYGSGI